MKIIIYKIYIIGQHKAIYNNTLPFMASVFYFGLMYNSYMASLGFVPVVILTLIFLGLIQINYFY